MKLSIPGLFAILFSFFGCSQKTKTDQDKVLFSVAEKIRISELESALNHLKNHETEFDFIGITSNGIDCIYFVNEDGHFHLEFEAMVEEQIPYIAKLKEFITSNSYKYIITSYGNPPDYASSKPAPVIRIETSMSLTQIRNLTEKIQSEIFGNGSETIYEVVP